MSKHKQKHEEPDEEFQNNPFGNLGLDLPPGDPAPAIDLVLDDTANPLTGVTVKIQLEKKGRGGKTVTVLFGFPLALSDDVDALAKDMRKSLGTGGTAYDDRIELQGDIRKKAADWLQKNGFKIKGDLG
jgi:translation initiation factor 1